MKFGKDYKIRREIESNIYSVAFPIKVSILFNQTFNQILYTSKT